MFSTFFMKLVILADVFVSPNDCDPNDTRFNPHHSFFGFPTWWRYIHHGSPDGFGHCTPTVNFPNGIWNIAFAIIDMLLYLAGLVAVISIIIAGVTYVVSMGNSEKTTSARKRLINSLIGLAIVLSASVLVSFIGNRIG